MLELLRLVVVASCGLVVTAEPVQKAGMSGCHWEDRNGNNVGRTITFIPPDTPASGGYTCKGICMVVPPSEPCAPGAIIDRSRKRERIPFRSEARLSEGKAVKRDYG